MKTVISKSKIYPAFWEINEKPVMLIGGSREDNLFQIDNLEEHLKLLASQEGNYVRCTMSSRDEGDVWPFLQNDQGIYDLTCFSRKYWERFEKLLSLAENLGIIVQIELWDRFDFARDPWLSNPYNPLNNVNYSSKDSGLKEAIDTHPLENENRFFYSVPLLDNNSTIFSFQKSQIDRLLSISLKYGNILYCMDNETNGAEEWGKFWSLYVIIQAEKQGKKVYTTEMWDNWDLTHEQHNCTFDHPEYYSFCDISQNNQQRGDKHWQGLSWARERTKTVPRPLNCVKVYGAESNNHGSLQDGQERFWKSLLGGAAAVRFHRPPSGLGLSPLAQNHIKSARLFCDRINIFECSQQNNLLLAREESNSYAMGEIGKYTAVLFTGEGEVKLDISHFPTPLSLTWLDILNCRWLPQEAVKSESPLRLYTPGKGFFIGLIKSDKP
jgi:hypothetical protein